MSSGVTWDRFFRRLLDFKSPIEIEDGLREEFLRGGLEDMTAEELEKRITQMRKISTSGGLNQ